MYSPNQLMFGFWQPTGVLEDRLLLRQSVSSFRSVLAGKVSGLRHMSAVLVAQPLQTMALFSSVSSIVAPLGQANYAAANSMLNNWATSHADQGDHLNQKKGKLAHISPVFVFQFLVSSFIRQVARHTV